MRRSASRFVPFLGHRRRSRWSRHDHHAHHRFFCLALALHLVLLCHCFVPAQIIGSAHYFADDAADLAH
jgi:hypothetical protein